MESFIVGRLTQGGRIATPYDRTAWSRNDYALAYFLTCSKYDPEPWIEDLFLFSINHNSRFGLYEPDSTINYALQLPKEEMMIARGEMSLSRHEKGVNPTSCAIKAAQRLIPMCTRINLEEKNVVHRT